MDALVCKQSNRFNFLPARPPRDIGLAKIVARKQQSLAARLRATPSADVSHY